MDSDASAGDSRDNFCTEFDNQVYEGGLDAELRTQSNNPSSQMYKNSFEPCNSEGTTSRSCSLSFRQKADNGDTFVKEEIREKQCPICFLEIVDETRTDACRHRFCFYCASEWIKTKAECCICKRPIKKLFHNFSGDPYSEREIFDTVTTEEIQAVGKLEALRRDASSRPMDNEKNELNILLKKLRRNNREIESYFRRGRRRGLKFSKDDPTEVNRLMNIELINRLTVLRENWDRPRGDIVADPTFRILVYERMLVRVPLVTDDESERVTVTPRFFELEWREQKPRLFPFIRREIAAMMSPMRMGDNALSAISERVYQLMTVSQVNEPQFTVALANELACSRFRVDHFAHRLEYNRRRGVATHFQTNDDSTNDIEVEFESLPNGNCRPSRYPVTYPAFLPSFQRTLNFRNRMLEAISQHNPFSSFQLQKIASTLPVSFSTLVSVGVGDLVAQLVTDMMDLELVPDWEKQQFFRMQKRIVF
ncbi:unnamed protein product [Enterobius vermicularis]|uniref:RING-type E3 ubiquitin transferase n=1 Tax=Enterobius vermicularis TaxID=51028 RepID=A0A0N4UUJ4_ENTVE|nr:unnamed protein product [Enterobius vermicularis]